MAINTARRAEPIVLSHAPRAWRWVFRVLVGLSALVFFSGSLAFAAVFVKQSGGVASAWAEVLATQQTTIALTNPAAPQSVEPGEEPGPVWGGKERVNIL